MKVGIFGTRSFLALDLVAPQIASLPERDIIVSGNSEGVDSEVRHVCERLGRTLMTVFPNYPVHRRAAGLIRDRKILELSDRLIIFWDEKNKHTKDLIDTARLMGKQVSVILDPPPSPKSE